MRISDEAVEAAEEYFSLLMADPNGDYTMEARDLLEAAASHLMAQALREAVEAFPLETITAPDNAIVWLMKRAEQIEQESRER